MVNPKNKVGRDWAKIGLYGALDYTEPDYNIGDVAGTRLDLDYTEPYYLEPLLYNFVVSTSTL